MIPNRECKPADRPDLGDQKFCVICRQVAEWVCNFVAKKIMDMKLKTIAVGHDVPIPVWGMVLKVQAYLTIMLILNIAVLMTGPVEFLQSRWSGVVTPACMVAAWFIFDSVRRNFRR